LNNGHYEDFSSLTLLEMTFFKALFVSRHDEKLSQGGIADTWNS